MKIFNASPGFSDPLTEDEIVSFLVNQTHNIHLGTIDEKKHPNIHPTWYYYDPNKNKIYVETARNSKKIQNISNNQTIYFCIDDPKPPYRGVRGKGKTAISQSLDFNLMISKKIMIKYLGSLDNPMAKILLGNVEQGNSVILEITPLYFSTWDYGKNKKI